MKRQDNDVINPGLQTHAGTSIFRSPLHHEIGLVLATKCKQLHKVELYPTDSSSFRCTLSGITSGHTITIAIMYSCFFFKQRCNVRKMTHEYEYMKHHIFQLRMKD